MVDQVARNLEFNSKSRTHSLYIDNVIRYDLVFVSNFRVIQLNYGILLAEFAGKFERI